MPEKNVDQRQCLYRGKQSKIFDGPEAVEAALEQGWVDHPDKTDAGDEPEYDNELEECAAANQKLHQDLNEASEKINGLEAALQVANEQTTTYEGQLKEMNDRARQLEADNEKLVKAAAKKK